MHRHFLIAFALLLVVPTFAAPPEELAGEKSVTLQGGSGTHTFTVKLIRRHFDKTKHQLERRFGYPDDDQWILGTVDSKEPIGVDGNIPLDELQTYTVIVDGKSWAVPGSLWRDVFNPVLSNDPKFRLSRAVLSKDGTRLWVKIEGGDAASAYRAEWNLRASGKHTRKITLLEE